MAGKLRSNPENRLWAKVIDLAAIQVVGYACSWINPMLAVGVMSLGWSILDPMNAGQSPGKWLLGLHTIEIRRGHFPTYYQSFIRNLPFLVLNVGIHFYHMFFGKILLSTGLACTLFELYAVFQVGSGVRVGDIIGSTRVFDYKDEHTKFVERYLKEQEPEGI